MGKSSQRKGAAGENELAEILSQTGHDCHRCGSMTFGEVPDISGLPGIHIEVKRVEHLNVGAAMEQAIRDSQRMKDGAPALFHRKNRKPWLVTMLLDDWLRMYGTTDSIVPPDPHGSFTVQKKDNSKSVREHGIKDTTDQHRASPADLPDQREAGAPDR